MSPYPAGAQSGAVRITLPRLGADINKITRSHFRGRATETLVFRQKGAAGTPVKPIALARPDVLIGQPKQAVSPIHLDLQARLRTRWPAIVAQARELEKSIPDPVQAIIDLLGSLPGDYATWREILEEPYG